MKKEDIEEIQKMTRFKKTVDKKLSNKMKNLTEIISIPSTTKMSELFGFNSHYYQQITMNSITEIIRPQRTGVTLLKNALDSSVSLEKQKEKLRSEKVQGYYKLADGEQWIQTGHGKIAQKIPQKKESKL